jgi:hypothetical protein
LLDGDHHERLRSLVNLCHLCSDARDERVFVFNLKPKSVPRILLCFG